MNSLEIFSIRCDIVLWKKNSMRIMKLEVKSLSL